MYNSELIYTVNYGGQTPMRGKYDFNIGNIIVET